jgi:hypothetical protein
MGWPRERQVASAFHEKSVAVAVSSRESQCRALVTVDDARRGRKVVSLGRVTPHAVEPSSP